MRIIRSICAYKVQMFLIFFILEAFTLCGQGLNTTWLLGYFNNRGRITFTDTSYNYVTEIRKIPFTDTQGNISDENGNLLMSSNGIFIANATGDTMQGGGGLNPNLYTDAHKQYGLTVMYGNIIIPMPDDTNKYVLFHQTGSDVVLASTEIYYSMIDMSYNSGLGKVTSKNNIIKTGTFGYGLTACKHGNGRDWWVFSISINADSVYKYLLTHDSIYYMGSQYLNLTVSQGWAGQPTFSPDGNKFSFATGYGNSSSGNWYHDVRIFDFDRCSGMFSNEMLVPLTADSIAGFGIAFSPDSKKLYVSSWQTIYQLNVDTINIPASLKIVAVNDSFPSPSPPFYTDFWEMYLAANGKIYITSGSSVVDLHYINYPDSADTACDVHLHDLHLIGVHARSVPNHPNYYLGRLVGSPCDTLTSVNDLTEHDFKFSLSPNPTNGSIKIVYLLPQNQKGVFEVYDVTGKKVFSYHLPQWSTLQNLDLSFLGNGVYQCLVRSNNYFVSKKLVVIK
ncbi:MAG: T9SS type A sorting domain-containing protein [Bacteroidetes bacterium]|nr:T9SS type A sorting domain-containing protein [Bacteroidota bacterium]